MFCRPLGGLCNSGRCEPRVTLAALAHPGLSSATAPRLVNAVRRRSKLALNTNAAIHRRHVPDAPFTTTLP